ncbi:Anti-sigma regulatory factor (Ser/Thr protein kinase) [Saccharopolyspora kobensis]|uniref:Anti-sigma regulatory factor (Ser/Thr protein kinase) n=1 Tax=Saccharopolyspora kobensis TaxID=146035 RepID=A0A1H6ADU9_9PSEU|nr:ATP-binding protein [Saccharopolyspora kobensis]SEG46227.1 Anti-sigma regulatory factor (Ser/Thr protein kinase) [Saccharopolyspora kobensis]SFE54258.1 serine/threonine-protein kinase RsbW [Saccharopolyspora kobensis]
MVGELDESRRPSATGGGGGDPAVPALSYCFVELSPGKMLALRDELTTWGRYAGLSREAAGALALACYEAMANVIEHAYAGDGTVDVEAVHLAAENRVEVTVTDRGRWAPPGSGGHTGRGQGLPLIRSLADEAVITPGGSGTVVRMSWSTGDGSG